MIPQKTLSRYQHKGSKVDKARITAHLNCNADGSHKLDPWLIGNSKNPRAFGRQNQKIKAMPFIYGFNKKAWMTGEIFRQYLEWFDNQMVRRQVLLLCDRFSAHEAAIHAATDREELRLRYTRVEFLPANATSLYQPLDQGIINNIKVYYRKYWLTFMLHLTMSDRDPCKEVTLFNAVWWLIDAWFQRVSPTTIANCWRKSQLFGLVFGPEPKPKDWDEEVEEIRRLAKELNFAYEPEDIAAFVNPEEESIQEPSGNMLDHLAMIYSEQLDHDEADGEEIEEMTPEVSLGKATEALETLISFEKFQEDLSLDWIFRLERRCNQLKQSLILEKGQKMKQGNLGAWLGRK